MPFSFAYGEDLGYYGYHPGEKSVEEKLNELKNDNSFSVYEQEGWIIASAQNGVMFSFTPSHHPAHPAYVERRIVERDNTVGLEMSVRCGASKKSCDDLVRSFQELNKAIIPNPGD